jgi:spore coat protein U-like protein
MKSHRPSQFLRLAIVSSFALASSLCAVSGQAATSTSSMGVSATVVANCTVTANAIAFTGYIGAALDASTTVSATCTNGTAAAITLSEGANADTGSTATVPVRRLKEGANYLGYQLYSDTGRATVWGNDATSDVGFTGTGVAQSFIVYGRVAGGQTPMIGEAYADTVTVTVTF